MKSTLPKPNNLIPSFIADKVLLPRTQPKVLLNSTSAANMNKSLPEQQVITSSITALRLKQSVRTIMQWAHRRESKAVCVANVHMLMEAHGSQEFSKVLRNADMVTPDGMPLVWMMRLLGRKGQNRVAGMDILQALCQKASEENVKVFFLGSQKSILDKMHTRLEKEYPNLQIAAMKPLPFRKLTPAEDEALIEEINESGAGIVFLSLGCPKQETWISNHQGKVEAVMIGLGGVFPVYAGLKKWAPRWVRQAGLEWLYRLVQEPKRLIGRYSQTIPPFIFLACFQLMTHHLAPKRLLNAFNL